MPRTAIPTARLTPLATALAACLAGALAAAPAAAQATFEGVITMRMRTERSPEPMTMRYLVRKGILRNEVSMGGMQMVVIVDPAKREAYSVMPAQRMYMVMALPDPNAASPGGATPQVTRTGRKETVAGRTCEHFLMKMEGDTVDACLATDMPPMVLGGGPGGGAGAAPAWARTLGSQAGFPLKVTTQSGSAVLEVTSIEPKALDASLFAPPAGFQRMQMPGGAPRRP